MASISAALNSALPAPKHKYESESSTTTTAPSSRILGSETSSSLVLKKNGPPPYGQRSTWRPRTVEDFSDGGAFPEIPIAQYPLDMGRSGSTTSTSKALSLQVDASGKLKYDAIVRQGHDSNRIIHASFKDLIPLRQRADIGEISLERPSEEEVAEQTEKTRKALEKLVSGAVAAQKPKMIKGTNKREATFVRYTPSSQMGDTSKKNERIIKIVEKQIDPMEPPKFKHKKIPRGPPSPPPPVMHSPPRKLTAADQEAWRIPPPVSNWKNPKGFTVPLDKRLAADGRGLQDVSINDNFARLSEALYAADRHAREEVRQRAAMQRKLAEKEKASKEENLRQLAQKAREAALQGRGGASTRGGRSRSGSVDSRSSRSGSESERSDSEDEEAMREREQMRRERRKEEERKLRMQRMGAERRLQVLAKESGRDISEKMALGLAKPTQSQESQYDSRLFNQTSAFTSGFNEDQLYDKPLFGATDALAAIYRPRAHLSDDEDEAADKLDRMTREKRFDVLGKAKKSFKGADKAQREGPVVFDKAEGGEDYFNVDSFLEKVELGVGAGRGGRGGDEGRKHGLQREEPERKRARVEEDSE